MCSSHSSSIFHHFFVIILTRNTNCCFHLISPLHSLYLMIPIFWLSSCLPFMPFNAVPWIPFVILLYFFPYQVKILTNVLLSLSGVFKCSFLTPNSIYFMTNCKWSICCWAFSWHRGYEGEQGVLLSSHILVMESILIFLEGILGVYLFWFSPNFLFYGLNKYDIYVFSLEINVEFH